MSICNIFTKSFIESTTGVQDFKINKDWLNSHIPKFNASTSGVWLPIIIKSPAKNPNLYGHFLGHPQNLDDSKVPPCQCNNVGSRQSRNLISAYGNFFSEEPENGMYCEYCEGLNQTKMDCRVGIKYTPKDSDAQGAGSILYAPISEPVTDPPTGDDIPYTGINCCQGGCDTRMLTDDITPKIPYLDHNYFTKFYDFKYLKQFPAIENPGLGLERFITYEGKYSDISVMGNGKLSIDWIMKPRIGEIPPDETDTYHSNYKAHKKSYTKYLSTNKTCGNFILQSANTGTSAIAAWQYNNMPTLSGLIFTSSITGNIQSLDQIIPSVDQFTIPYGITSNTHWNIFTKPKYNKLGGFWKWNMDSGVLCWYRYFNKDKKNDDRLIPGVDLYISDGDVFFARNDGPEPLPISGAPSDCRPRPCPSGLKLTNYETTDTTGTITVIPSGSQFIYISQNIYDKVYQNTESLLNLYRALNIDKTYREVFNTAAILATGPQYDGVTVDLWSNPLAYREYDRKQFIDLISELTGDDISDEQIVEDLTKKNTEPLKLRDSFMRNDAMNKTLSNKEMPSYNNLNMVRTPQDLINTLVHKYGSYIWIGPDSDVKIEIEKKINHHCSVELDFEPVVKLSDTRSSSQTQTQILTCESTLRGRTKVFGYDQEFSIGDSYLKANILSDKLVYSAQCIGDPPIARINELASVMSVVFNDENIFRYAYGNFQTSFIDIYSRFPSVSSTLDYTFTDLEETVDYYQNTDVFKLNPDRQLRLNRKYDGFVATPHIDIAGFHKDGGCYYDSLLLSKYPGTGTVAFKKNWKPNSQKDNLVFGFKTYDIGIKLYSVSAEHLRSDKNLNCKTLPLDQPCKCWGINKVDNYPYTCSDSIVYETPRLFTPFLSTAPIPLLAYGGYSEDEVNKIFGDFRIPGHPIPQNKLPYTVKILDPENLNGCIEKTSITLPNYVASKWKVQVPNFDTNNASIWVSFSDSFGFGGTSRTQNRIKVNGTEIFPNQQTQIEAASNTFDIEIYNQLLTTIFDQPEAYLYNQSMYSCSLDRIDQQYTPDYMRTSSITLNFGRLPSKGILSFKMPTIQSWGRLQKDFFDPNMGLSGVSKIGSSLQLDQYNGLFNFDYGYKLFNDKKEYTTDNQHQVFRGSGSLKAITNLNRFLNNINDSKKLKLYVKLNNKHWYEYNNHRTFGYFNIQENQQYHSWPTFFRESHLPSDQAFGAFIPAIPKVPLEHIYFRNTQTWQNISTSGLNSYPYFDHKFKRDPNNKKLLIIPGSRAYFMFPHVSGANTGIFDNYTINQYTAIRQNIISEDQVKYADIYEPNIIANTCIDLVPDDIYSVTASECTLDNVSGTPEGFNLAFIKPNKVLKKAIAQNLDIFISGYPNQNLVNKYNNIYTLLYMEQDHPHDEGYLGFFDEDSSTIRFSLFATTQRNNLDKADILSLNKYQIQSDKFSNKWADIHYYNNTADILNNQQYINSINDVYGPFLYSNLLSYVIHNNFSLSHLIPNTGGICTNKFNYNFYIMNSGYSGNIAFQDPQINYYIHQPFSVGQDKYPQSLDRYNLFKNANPVLDINLYDSSPIDPERPLYKYSQCDKYGRGITGVMAISGIYRPSYMYPIELSNTSFPFFVDLNDKFFLKPVPIKDDGNIYSRSFVLSESYNVFEGLALKNNPLPNANTSQCTQIITPRISIPPLLSSNSPFNWQNFNKITTIGKPYVSYPVYCDKDTVGECGADGLCRMDTIANIDISSKFRTYTYRYRNINSIEDNCEFALSIDAGLYCPLGLSSGMPYIVRAQINEYSPLFPTYTLDGSSSCIDGRSYPPLERGLSVWDDLYQSEIDNNIVDNLPVDVWANEVLFRSMYGSKQKFNTDDISSASAINKNNEILNTLINNPDNNISFIYNNIPYDYDTGSTATNIKINGAIQIGGRGAIGDVIRFTFNDSVYNIIITEDEKDVFVECKELNAKGIILEKQSVSKSTWLRQKGSGATRITGPNISEKVIGECITYPSTSISIGCSREAGNLGPNCSAEQNGGGDYQWRNRIDGPIGPCDLLCYSTLISAQPRLVYGSWPSVFNKVPCSAFSYKDTTAEASYLDQTFTRYGISTAVGGPGGATAPYECGNYSVYPCRTKSNCCDNKTTLVKTLNYRIKNCHYDFIMRGLVTNNLYNIASFTVEDSGHPDCPIIPPYRKPDVYKVHKKCCDCSTYGMNPGCSNLAEQLNDVCCNPLITYNDVGEPVYTTNPECLILLEQHSDIFEDLQISYQEIIGWGCFFGFNLYISNMLFQIYNDGCCQKYCNGGGQPIACNGTDGPWNGAKYNCTEKLFVYSCTTPEVVWEIVETTEIGIADSSYTAGCNRHIATISYDNNQLKINLGVKVIRDGVVVANGGNCVPKKIQSCPYIKIELPDGTYGITDSIDSSCQQCSTDSKTIEILENPKFELQVDTNLCVLGTLVVGGTLDVDWTTGGDCRAIGGSGGSAYGWVEEGEPGGPIGFKTCGRPPTNYGDNSAIGDWYYFISHPLLSKEGGELSNICTDSVIVPNGKQINFPNVLTNNSAKEKYIKAWKDDIQMRYESKYICSNSYDYTFDELIEGVVPGTCKLEFKTVDWPVLATRIKGTVKEDGEKEFEKEDQQTSLQVIVAYMSYQYKHPVSLNDKMIDTFSKEITSSQCRTYNSASGPANNCRMSYFGNMKERLSSRETANSNCKTSPNCYDRGRDCDPNKPCCQFDKPANTYRQG